ncbi:MAG: radical SAM protein [Candidatus Pacebacteria bacterium]|nr:radical SAM protein [Candidatus Paceibacterota bacterium]
MPKTILNKLIKGGFLISNYSEDYKNLEQKRKESSEPCINNMYLLLNEGCNLACSYCFFEGSFVKPPMLNPMSLSFAKEAIDFYSKILKKVNPSVINERQKLINFYGGEPLLNREVFEKSVTYINGLMNDGILPNDTRLSLNTNGTVMDNKLARFITKNKIEVGVSIDGPRLIHDLNRRYINGKGTFRKAVTAFKMLQDAGANVGVSCTVSERTVDEMPEILNWLINDMGIKGMGFNPLIEYRGFKIADDAYAIKIAENLIKCFKIARDKNIYEDRMMRKVKAFVIGYFYDRDCSAIGRQIVFGPNETVGVCMTYYASGKYFVRFDKHFDPFTNPVWIEWGKRMPLNMPKCLGCEALGICGGGCPFNADMRNGGIWELDDFFCEHSKKTLEWLIWELFDLMEK